METVEINSRHGSRMEPTQNDALLHGLLPTAVPVAVIDESFGGIGVAVPLKLASEDSAERLSGREITVEYTGVSNTAVIRHVARLEAGCRLGLEWKAQALSRYLRDLLKLQPNVGEELTRFLPGGLSMMWKLYEAERWFVMRENADRLLRQIGTVKIDALIEPIERFRDAIRVACERAETQSPAQDVRQALDCLIQECIEVIS